MPAAAPIPRSHASIARALPWLVALSGAAALVYESLWLRSFGLIFGGTTSAVAMVLAVFMGGLAIGSALVARRAVQDPLLAYARLELAIGAAALVTLPLLRALPWAYGVLVARSGLSGALEHAGIALLAALVLLPATILLGATVPLAVEFLSRAGLELHAGFGRLYLLNTLGGAAGVALAPFVLVPALGVQATLVAAAAGSLFVGGVALRLAREAGPVAATAVDAPPASGAQGAGDVPAGSALGLALALASGAATFGAEVLWTRSYALVIGSSVYAFSLVLLAVLVGIAAGSAVYGRWRSRILRPAQAVGWLFLFAGLAVLAGQWAIGRLPIVSLVALELAARLVRGPPAHVPRALLRDAAAGHHRSRAHLSAAAAPRRLARENPRRAAGRLYAWNTAGAIAGALATDLVLVPRPRRAAAVPRVRGAARRGRRLGPRRRRPPRVLVGPAAGGAIVAAALWLAPRWPPWDPVVMTSGVHRYGLEWIHRLDTPWQLASWLREQRRCSSIAKAARRWSRCPRRTRARVASCRSTARPTPAAAPRTWCTQKFVAHVPMLLHPGRGACW